jgi:hypothetical protein
MEDELKKMNRFRLLPLPWPEAKFDGDGNRLLASFLAQGDSFCNAFNSDGGIPTTRISVAELSMLTGTDASAADLNRDGLVNGKDIAFWQRAQAAARKPMSAKSVDRD